jgi:hypothetical protein
MKEIDATLVPAPPALARGKRDGGRAHDNFFIAAANGSNQVLGLDNVFIITTLKQTAPDFYVIASCP